jgi:hypothetical protein
MRYQQIIEAVRRVGSNLIITYQHQAMIITEKSSVAINILLQTYGIVSRHRY